MILCCSNNSFALLRGITSKHDGDFYYLNCLHFFQNKKQT